MFECHAFALVLEGVQRQRLPLHATVLCHQLHVLRRPERPRRPHAVQLLRRVADLDAAGLLEHLVGVEGLHGLAEVGDGGEASAVLVQHALVDSRELVGQEPEVVMLGLRARRGYGGLQAAGTVEDEVGVGVDALVLNNVCSFIGTAARAEDDEDGYRYGDGVTDCQLGWRELDELLT